MAVLAGYPRPDGARAGRGSRFSAAVDLIRNTYSEWSEDNASRLAAALAYYAIFSLAPLLIIAIAMAGLVFGKEAATDHLAAKISDQVGPEAAQGIMTFLRATEKSSSGMVAIGFATLFVGAAGAFSHLQDCLNTIWDVKPKAGRGLKEFLRERALSFAMVLAIGFLLLASLGVSAVLSGMEKFLSHLLPMPGFVLQAANFCISFAVTLLLFALLFKVLPDAYVRWRDVWVGASVTALLFSAGRLAIGLYLGRSSVTSLTGAAGSLVILLLWVYYSSQILFLGAEFTQVYAKRFGRKIRPKPNAEPLHPPPDAPPPQPSR